MNVAEDVRLARYSDQIRLLVEYALGFVDELEHECLAYGAHLHQIGTDQLQVWRLAPLCRELVRWVEKGEDAIDG